MKVFRIQNEDGYGPYVSRFTLPIPEIDIMCNKHAGDAYFDSALWPTSFTECTRERGEDYRCGFINEAQLFNWFSEEEIEMLRRNGYDIVALDKEVTVIGKNQIVFTP